MAHVLLVEDDAVFAMLYARAFERAGHSVTHASDSTQALAQLAVVRPQVVVLDILLPGQNGLWLLKELRRQPALRDLPVVFLSNLAESEFRMPSALRERLGIAGYFVKTQCTPQQVIARCAEVSNSVRG